MYNASVQCLGTVSVQSLLKTVISAAVSGFLYLLTTNRTTAGCRPSSFSFTPNHTCFTTLIIINTESIFFVLQNYFFVLFSCFNKNICYTRTYKNGVISHKRKGSANDRRWSAANNRRGSTNGVANGAAPT